MYKSQKNGEGEENYENGGWQYCTMYSRRNFNGMNGMKIVQILNQGLWKIRRRREQHFPNCVYKKKTSLSS